MHLTDLFSISHRNFSAFRTRSLASIIVIGILFGFILGATLILQGLENVVLCHAGEFTSGAIYLASDYDKGKRPELILERIARYDGEVVKVDVHDLEYLGFTPQYVAVFHHLAKAYDYYRTADEQEFNYSPQHYHIAELYTNQMSAYDFFYNLKKNLQPLLIVLIIAAMLILTFTTAHLVAQDSTNIVLYRSLGASRWQIFSIYLAYLLELCFYAAIFAIVLALLLAGIATGISWQYLNTALTEFYPNTKSYAPILIGLNGFCGIIISSMFISAPLAFLLSIDQFSTKKIAFRLKEN